MFPLGFHKSQLYTTTSPISCEFYCPECPRVVLHLHIFFLTLEQDLFILEYLQ